MKERERERESERERERERGREDLSRLKVLELAKLTLHAYGLSTVA